MSRLLKSEWTIFIVALAAAVRVRGARDPACGRCHHRPDEPRIATLACARALRRLLEAGLPVQEVSAVFAAP